MRVPHIFPNLESPPECFHSKLLMKKYAAKDHVFNEKKKASFLILYTF